MKRRLLWLAVLTLALITIACGGDDVADPDNGAAPTPATTGDQAGTIQLVVTVDNSMVDLEDEELSPILDRIDPQLETILTNAGLALVSIQRIGPRSIAIEVEGNAATVVPQVQQLIDAANFEIPLTVTQLAPQ